MRVEPTGSGLPARGARDRDARRARALDDAFLALADPTRRGVIELLRSQPRRAGELAAQLGKSRPAMSRHLKLLRTSGLIEAARPEAGAPADHDARARSYQLRPEAFSALRGWLDEVEQLWTGQLAAFKAHAEARRPRGAKP
jgi:DNA-binding transcriptional ArsR family regulator